MPSLEFWELISILKNDVDTKITHILETDHKLG